MNKVDYQYYQRLSEAQSLSEIIKAEIDWKLARGNPIPSTTEQPMTSWGLQRLIQIERISAGLDQESISQMMQDWQKLMQMSKLEK